MQQNLATNKRHQKRAQWSLDSQHVARVCGGRYVFLMSRVLISILVLLLNGCVLIQFSTDVSLGKSDTHWYVYISEPTSEMEFSKHGLFFGNLPERYRVIIPKKDGEYIHDSFSLEWSRTGNMAYESVVATSGGYIKLENCVVTIELYINSKPADFNGIYELAGYECSKT